MSILGNRVVRSEDVRMLTVGGSYVEDLPLDGGAHVAYARSVVPHGRITSIDTSTAAASPGVIAVFTGADVPRSTLPIVMPAINEHMGRPLLGRDRVRFVGEPVAAIVAETRAQAVDALAGVAIEYEELHAVVDPEDALRDEVLLFPEAGTNVAVRYADDPDDAFFDGCDVVVSLRMVSQRLNPAPLEARAAAAEWSGGRLVFWASTQRPHLVRSYLEDLMDLPPERVRVVTPDVGGGFGAKGRPFPEELLVAWLAREVGRPLRWVESRTESMISISHGRGQIQRLELGATSEGDLVAYRLRLLQDGGAYPGIGAGLVLGTRRMAQGTYAISRLETNCVAVVTNTSPTSAYRGAGRPEATQAIERAVDVLAAELGMDPADLRRRNLIPPDAFPYRTHVQHVYDSGDYEVALDAVLRAARYTELRAEQRARRERGDPLQLGIGMASYVEVTSGIPGIDFGSVTTGPDGRVVVRTSSGPTGQGHETAWAMLVADRLPVPLEHIRVVSGDTDEVPRGVGTFGSRSLQTPGIAVHRAAGLVAQRATDIAARLLEASPSDVVIDTDRRGYHVAGAPFSFVTWREVVDAARDLAALSAEVDEPAEHPSFPFGAHLAVVELDVETAKVRLLRHFAVDDAGPVINPGIFDGQIHGGIAQGAAQALFEEFLYDPDGNPITTNFVTYGIPSAVELPAYDLVAMETRSPNNPLGVKGVGESGTIGSTPAIHNAVIDALSPFGVRHLDMPFTLRRVFEAIRRASGASDVTALGA